MTYRLYLLFLEEGARNMNESADKCNILGDYADVLKECAKQYQGWSNHCCSRGVH